MGVLAKRLVACTQPIISKGTSPCSGPCYGSILGRVGENEISGKPCSLLLDWIDAKSAREKAGWFLDLDLVSPDISSCLRVYDLELARCLGLFFATQK